MKNCNECKYINITEEQQTVNKENHICKLFNKKLYHNSNVINKEQNYIYPNYKCNGKYFKVRSNT